MDLKEIEKLADLARLNIQSETATEVAESITSILAMVDQLQAVDTAGVEPMAHPQKDHQRLRADRVDESDLHEKFQAIAPQTESGLYLVPKVIE